MFTEAEKDLLNRVLKTDFFSAHVFARNVKRQGFMTSKQYQALTNMYNSVKPWSSRTNKTSRHDGWDHDDLAEGWAGY
jgi:hypothetical protein